MKAISLSGNDAINLLPVWYVLKIIPIDGDALQQTSPILSSILPQNLETQNISSLSLFGMKFLALNLLVQLSTNSYNMHSKKKRSLSLKFPNLHFKI